MRYLLTADFSSEPCSFGNRCPAGQHFSTKPHADAHSAGGDALALLGGLEKAVGPKPEHHG